MFEILEKGNVGRKFQNTAGFLMFMLNNNIFFQ
jgi:hypothetical protein